MFWVLAHYNSVFLVVLKLPQFLLVSQKIHCLLFNVLCVPDRNVFYYTILNCKSQHFFQKFLKFFLHFFHKAKFSTFLSLYLTIFLCFELFCFSFNHLFLLSFLSIFLFIDISFLFYVYLLFYHCSLYIFLY